ncbi:sensor histidine kinase [Agromyces lapidis]|uniref:Sensor histidine kinase n=1 Tax=Agromyces lapidis TaxID=279574 RepID=A0ABV5SVA8_9MICO|nr:ATP-binding protein [Agromyces lapidis]
MSLGLPGHLARDSLSRSLAFAGHCAAFACLTVTIVVSVIVATVGERPNGWTGAALAAVMMLALAAVARYPSVTLTVLALVVGTGATIAFTMLVMEPGGFESTNNAVLALPRIALLLVGGAGSGSLIAIVWASLGYALGEAAAFLGVALVGGSYAPSTAAAAAFGILLVVRIFDGASRRSDPRQETGLHRASQQTRELAIRHDYELRATARLHDTALSHLIAIAAAGSGTVDERLRAGIRQDLGLIVGRDWAIDHSGQATANDRGGPRRAAPVAEPSPNGRAARGRFAGRTTAGAVTRARTAPLPAEPRPGGTTMLVQSFAAAGNAGLDVRVTGDPEILHVLGPGRAEALDAAVAQCLINVARHAGVDEAELALGLGGGEVTIAVMDSGVGFDEREVPDDRIGLRTSIRARIEQQDGTVRLWSTKGIGTTIVLTVPEGGA